MENKVYTARHSGHTNMYYLDGPAPHSECSYFSKYYHVDTMEEAVTIENFANMAYNEGIKQAQRNIRESLGLASYLSATD